MLQTLTQKSDAYWRLTRMDRPIGIYLLLWPTLIALWLASGGVPSVEHLVIFVGGTVLMRAAGCAINDFADRRIDGLVERTNERPLVSGELRPTEAVWAFVVLSLLALLLALALPIGAWPWLLPAAAVAFIYPFSKRFIDQPQAVLGLAFGFGIPIAFSSAQGQVGGVALLLFVANFFWVLAYDTLYALYDKPDDLAAGVKSMAIWLGEHDLPVIGVFQALHLLLYLWVGLVSDLGPLFYLAWAMAGLMALWQFVRLRRRHRQDFLQAFLQNHWLGFMLLLGVAGSI